VQNITRSKESRFMKHQSVLLPGRGFSLLLCLGLLISGANLAAAQSGRKISKRPPTPAPQTTAPSEPPITPSQPEQNTKPAIPILVTKYLPNFNSSNIYTDIVIEGFLARMASMKGIKIQPGREMNRKQASDAAKESEERYVVWIELLIDTVDQERANASLGQVNPYYLYVDYVVFEPGTGKQKASGHVYQRRGIGAGQGPLPVPNTSAGANYTLRKVGEETAERVLDKLNLIAPPVIRN